MLIYQVVRSSKYAHRILYQVNSLEEENYHNIDSGWEILKFVYNVTYVGTFERYATLGVNERKFHKKGFIAHVF